MERTQAVTVAVENVGQAYLEVLRARGIKYLFGNSGTDFGPIIDGLAKLAADKKEFPKPITVAHEFVAVSMAQGYAMITGEPQVVMVHVIVGTAGYIAAGLPHQAHLPPLSIGFVSLIGFALMAPLSSVTASYGARMAHRLSRRTLEIAFGMFLLVASLRFAVSLVS